MQHAVFIVLLEYMSCLQSERCRFSLHFNENKERMTVCTICAKKISLCDLNTYKKIFGHVIMACNVLLLAIKWKSMKI